jgi:hypothetical protein
MLTDRAYIGEVNFRGQWYPGKQEPIIDRTTWDRVQALLGKHVYRSHQLTYASELIDCGHCGRAITGERKFKQTKSGEREYVYYRCSGYRVAGHPRPRVTEADLDRQVLALFGRMRIEDDGVREWFRAVLQSQTRDAVAETSTQRGELVRQLTLLANQQDRLLNMRLADQVDEDTFAAKHTELRDRTASIKPQIDVLDRSRDETAELAVKVFELSHTLRQQWLTADYATKRRILEIVCSNCTLVDATLCPTIRKPFDVLAEGLVTKDSRGNWRSFEPLLGSYVDSAFGPEAEVVLAERLVRLTA